MVFDAVGSTTFLQLPGLVGLDIGISLLANGPQKYFLDLHRIDECVLLHANFLNIIEIIINDSYINLLRT